ncbi:MAG: DUF389 domain-containing protein [Bacteroidales bacterium]|nr:DUF389 domain-containing protein [Bacteroidales bacterium]
MDIKNFLKHYFDLMPDKADETATIESIQQGISFRGANLWVLILAILVASLGLNVNSVAVIIGAMLISPLMGPIVGMGLAVGIYDVDLLKRALKNFAIATGISILTATAYFILTPFHGDESELLARTSPTIYDVLIAFFGGAAGIIAMATKGKNNVLPGVAIATALMPPLCTAGYGLAEGNLQYFIGAFYLFLINSIFICDASILGIYVLRFQRKRFTDPLRFPKVRRIIIVIELILIIPAIWTTIVTVREGMLNSHVSDFVKNVMDAHGTQIVDTQLDKNSHTLRLVAVGNEISQQQIAYATERMSDYKLSGYTLRIIQGTVGDSVLRAKLLSTDADQALTLQTQNATIMQLKQELDNYRQYDDYCHSMIDEMTLLYPTVTSLSLTAPKRVLPSDTMSHRIVYAIVGLKPHTTLTTNTLRQMQLWIAARIDADSVAIITL